MRSSLSSYSPWSECYEISSDICCAFRPASWLLLVWSIPAYFTFVVGYGYAPTDRMAPIHQFDVSAAEFILAAGTLAATTSSIALGLKFRAVASILVIATRSAIAFGALAARLFVQPGPEYFERHLGTQAFSIPWQYATREIAREIGFGIRLCLANPKSDYDKDCPASFDSQASQDVRIRSPQRRRSFSSHKAFLLLSHLSNLAACSWESHGYSLCSSYRVMVMPSGTDTPKARSGTT